MSLWNFNYLQLVWRIPICVIYSLFRNIVVRRKILLNGSNEVRISYSYPYSSRNFSTKFPKTCGTIKAGTKITGGRKMG